MRLREVRKFNKLTQAQVASHLNVAISTYSGYETNNSEPSIEILIALSKLFSVSVDYLIGSDNVYDFSNYTLKQKELVKTIKQLNYDNVLILTGKAQEILDNQNK